MVPQSGLIAPGQRTILLLLLEIYNAVTLPPPRTHVLISSGSPADLVGKRVSLGVSGSSIRQNAHTFLAHYDISPKSVHDAEQHFGGARN